MDCLEVIPRGVVCPIDMRVMVSSNWSTSCLCFFVGGGQDESWSKALGTPYEGEDGSKAPQLPAVEGTLPDIWMVAYCTGMVFLK